MLFDIVKCSEHACNTHLKVMKMITENQQNNSINKSIVEAQQKKRNGGHPSPLNAVVSKWYYTYVRL